MERGVSGDSSESYDKQCCQQLHFSYECKETETRELLQLILYLQVVRYCIRQRSIWIYGTNTTFLKWYTKTKPLSLYFINVTQKEIKVDHTGISEIKFPNNWKWFPALAIYVQLARQLAVLLLKVQQKFYVLFMYKTEIQLRLKTSNN